MTKETVWFKKMNNDSMTGNSTEVDYGEHSVGTIISLSVAFALLIWRLLRQKWVQQIIEDT